MHCYIVIHRSPQQPVFKIFGRALSALEPQLIVAVCARIFALDASDEIQNLIATEDFLVQSSRVECYDYFYDWT